MSINNINCDNVKKEVTLPALAKDRSSENYYFIVKNFDNIYKLIQLSDGLIYSYNAKSIEDLLKYYKCELVSHDISLSYRPM